MSIPDPSASGRPHAASESSRRGFLLGSTAVVVIAGAGGAAVGVLRARSHPATPAEAPAVLLAAQRTELRLIADLDASIARRPVNVALLRQLLADHSAHLTALSSAIALTTGPAATAPLSPAGRPRTTAQLATAEQTASRTGTARALELTGTDAALLASIAACEATHAELLT
jgi:hypothetical protein